jgi:trehalose 6-phosphate synthase
MQNLEKESVKSRIAQLEQRFNGVKVIVGVDRLDYIKGVPQKLHALELFLTQHPEWIGKVSVGAFMLLRLVNLLAWATRSC